MLSENCQFQSKANFIYVIFLSFEIAPSPFCVSSSIKNKIPEIKYVNNNNNNLLKEKR